MVSNLAQWYTLSRLKGPSPEVLEKRVADIDSIVKKKPFDWILDCARTFLNKKVSNGEFKEAFVKLFTDSDPYFPQKKNELEVRILTGAVLFQYAKASKAKEKISGLQAIQSGIFGIPKKDLIHHDIIDAILRHLEEESISIREGSKPEQLKINTEALTVFDSPSVIAKIGNINDAIRAITNHLNNSISKRISLVDEESNIHWWIFRGFSTIKSKSFSDIDPKELPFIIGTELSELTKFIPGPYATAQYIGKVLKDAGKESTEITIKDFINKIDMEDKLRFAVGTKGFGNLTPLSVALELSKEEDAKNSWTSQFETQCALKTSEKFSSGKLALQLFNESLLLKHFEEK